MQTPEGITVVSTNYQDVLALRKSDALAAVEQTMATRCAVAIVQDDSVASISYTQAEISVSGMTPRPD